MPQDGPSADFNHWLDVYKRQVRGTGIIPQIHGVAQQLIIDFRQILVLLIAERGTCLLYTSKAYNDMPQNNLKFIIAKYRWLYQLGLQGPDMFFYNLPIPVSYTHLDVYKRQTHFRGQVRD